MRPNQWLPGGGRAAQMLSAAPSGPDQCVVRVASWLADSPVDEQFIVYERSARKVTDYVRKVGVRMTLRKVMSRFGERERNRKSYGIGIGWLERAPAAPPVAALEPGMAVLFFAPNHSKRWPFLALHRAFICPLMQQLDRDHRVAVAHLDLRPFAALSGHSDASGAALDTEGVQAQLKSVIKSLRILAVEARVTTTVPRRSHREYRTSTGDQIGTERPHRSRRPTAVVFGLGNYTKTTILPYIRRSIDVQRIHDIDPDQVSSRPRPRDVQLTTEPGPLDGKWFDAWFIAGHHHTHTPLAIAAMLAGSWAVIEKPLATTGLQCRELVATLDTTGGRFVACFQKRYSRMHGWAIEDLGAAPGSPIDMHCTVFEIPLPRLHWYNWPASGSRLLSNGCHWIDYFLFLNNFCATVEERVWPARGRDVGVQLQLENGACFSMILTDTGSPRLGVREHVELRAGSSTVSITDGASYVSESSTRIVRRKRVHPLDAHRRMYRRIGERILNDEPGDSLESLRSTEVTLRLDAQAVECLHRRTH